MTKIFTNIWRCDNEMADEVLRTEGNKTIYVDLLGRGGVNIATNVRASKNKIIITRLKFPNGNCKTKNRLLIKKAVTNAVKGKLVCYSTIVKIFGRKFAQTLTPYDKFRNPHSWRAPAMKIYDLRVVEFIYNKWKANEA